MAQLAGSFRGVNLVYIDLYANTPSSPTSYRASKLSGSRTAETCAAASSGSSPACCATWRAECARTRRTTSSGTPTTPFRERAYKIMMDELVARYIRFLR